MSVNIFDEVNAIVNQRNNDYQVEALKEAVENPVVNTDILLSPQRDADLAEALGIITDDADEVFIAPENAIADAIAQREQEKIAANGLQPRPYQLEGIEFLRTRKRAMLTDQAGLGKTLQAILAAQVPVLVIAPTYLTRQWHAAICAQYPELAAKGQVQLAVGSRMKRIKALRARAKWTIINIQMLRTFMEYINIEHFSTIIIDEAHHIRNRKATQSKLAAKVTRNPNKRVYLLTATPIWKNPDDLFHQLHVLQPKQFESYAEFVDLFCDTVDDHYNEIKVVGIKKGMTKHLNALLDIVRFGRTYKDVGRVLPPVINRYIKVNFPRDLKVKYDELKRYWALNLEGLEDASMLFSSYIAVLHTLRALTAFDGKVAALKEALDDCMGGTNPAPAVVFTWYKQHAYMIAKQLEQRYASKGLKVVCITGDVKPTERAAIAMSADIVVANISSMSEGVNMYHARSVHYFEENWVPGSNYQSLSRVRRDRNDDGADVEPVQVYYYHVAGTIDERIHNMSEARAGTIKELIRESLS